MANCLNCTEKCPQAELAHDIAKGRLYATNELVELVKKIESGKLVEVVRCKDCRYRRSTEGSYRVKSYNCGNTYSPCRGRIVEPTFGCLYGERELDNIKVSNA